MLLDVELLGGALVSNFLGLDLSLNNTGAYAYYSNNTSQGKTFKPNTIVPMNRLDWYYNNLIKDFIAKTDWTCVAIEGYSYASKGRGFDIGELGGLVKLALFKKKIPMIIVPPQTLKKFICGKGNVGKAVIIKEVFKKFNLDTDDDNIADARGLVEIAKIFGGGECKYPEAKIKDLRAKCKHIITL